MPIVFVVQRQQRWDSNSNQLVDKFDLSSAAAYGEIKYLLSPKAAPFHPESVISELHQKLDKFTADDYLLLVGNPCLIGFSVAIASDKTNLGMVKLLQFSGKEQRYIPISAQLFIG